MRRGQTVGVAEVAARVLGDMAMSAAHQMEEILPPEARLHLIRAQRELLLAMVATLEHHQEPKSRDQKAPRRSRRRVRKIALD